MQTLARTIETPNMSNHNVLWTPVAVRHYLKHWPDGSCRTCLDDLVKMVTEVPDGPSRGATLGELSKDDKWLLDVRGPLLKHGLRGEARVVLTPVPRPAGFPQPPAVAYLVHIAEAPKSTGCTQMILLLDVAVLRPITR